MRAVLRKTEGLPIALTQTLGEAIKSINDELERLSRDVSSFESEVKELKAADKPYLVAVARGNSARRKLEMTTKHLEVMNNLAQAVMVSTPGGRIFLDIPEIGLTIHLTWGDYAKHV